LIAAPSGNPVAVVNSQSFALGAVPGGGPETSQPPVSPPSNEVEPSPVETVMSSTKAPSPCVAQSLAYEIETSTCLPANLARSTLHSCQPPELPLAAHQSPLVPLGEHVVWPVCVW
jgi:hypothetical protein